MKIITRNELQDADKYDEFIYYLCNHSDFKSKIRKFYSVLDKNTEAQIESQSMNKLIQCIYRFLFPTFTLSQLQKIATEDIQILGNLISIEDLYQYFAQFCALYLFKYSIGSALSLVDHLYFRIVKHQYLNLINGKLSDIGYYVNIFIIKQFDNIIYREYLEEDQFIIQQSIKNQNIILYSQIRSVDEILPLGYSTESAICDIYNNKYTNVSDNLIQCHHININQWKQFKNIRIMVNIKEQTIQEIKDQQEFTLQYAHNLCTIFDRSIYLFNLKKYNDDKCYFMNVNSSFYIQDSLDIDLIDKLHKNIKTSQTQNKVTVNNFKFLALQDVRLYENLKFNQPSSGQISFKQYFSKNDYLPFDPEDTFYQDLKDYAVQNVLQLLVIGKPKIGKSTFAKLLSQTINIEYIDLEQLIQRIFNKIKLNDEDPKLDEEGNKIPFLDAIETKIINDLKNGLKVDNQDLQQLLNLRLNENSVKLKGFILDLPFDTKDCDFWIQTLTQNKLQIQKSSNRFFSHVLEFQNTDISVKFNQENIYELPDNFKLFSSYDREILKRPKKKLPGEEDKEDDEENVQKPVELHQLVQRQNELIENNPKYNQQIQDYVSQYMSGLKHCEHIQIERSLGFTPEQLVNSVIAKIKPLLIPLPQQLEPGSDDNLKELLTQGLEENDVPRRWSVFQQVDSVQLYNGKLKLGKAEFPCAYAGRVFLFSSEENQKAFLANPKQYLDLKPKMPQKYNLAIIGQRQSGKKTLAKMISQKYGWNIVDPIQIVSEILDKQKIQEKHIPSNFDPRINSIHPSEQEFKELVKGNSLNINSILPMIFFKLGVQLIKKVPVQEELTEEQQEEKRKQDLKDKKKKKQADETTEAPIEDLLLKDIGYIPKQDISGHIFVGYPYNEQQINELKEAGFVFDKIIYLSDNVSLSEELPGEPGSIIFPRIKKNNIVCNPDQELELAEKNLAVVKEQFGEELIKEVSIRGTPEEILKRVLNIIDPFYIKCDEESNIRVSADLPESGYGHIPWGNYADYCPVNFQNGQLLLGKEEFELQVQQKRYRFYGPTELATFKDNLEYYLTAQIKTPSPRILIMGIHGSGVGTQLRNLNKQFNLPVFKMKENFIQLIKEKKQIRKQQRILDRGFKPEEKDEEGNVIEDAEIAEEKEDFDKQKHEIEIFGQIFQNINEVIIDGNYFDVEEDLVTTPLIELMQQSKKLPEVVVILKIGENNQKEFLTRVFDRKRIEKIWEEKCEERKAIRKKEKEQARLEALAALEEGEQLPEEQENQEEEEDPEMPNLQEMIDEETNKVQAVREAQQSKIDELQEQFTENKINIISIDADKPLDKVFKEICYSLKPILNKREEKIQQKIANPISEELLKYYEKCFNYKKSRFYDFSPIDVFTKSRQNALLYKDRIYYASNQDELQKIIQNPIRSLQNETVPLDVSYVPKIFVIGLGKTGKSSLCKNLEEKLKIVRIKMSTLIRDCYKDPFSLNNYNLVQALQDGQQITNEILIRVIIQRIQQQDCLQNGFVLDGFPQNQIQAQLLEENKVIPTNVIYCCLDDKEIIQRNQQSIKLHLEKIEKLKKPEKEEEGEEEQKKDKFNPILKTKEEYDQIKFGYNFTIINKRKNSQYTDLIKLQCYFISKFNNLIIINSKISKWGCFDLCNKAIFKTIKCRQEVAKSLITHNPVCLDNFNLTKEQIIQNLNQDFNLFCPVSQKAENLNKIQKFRSKQIVYYLQKLHIFDSQEKKNEFLNNPYIYFNANKNWTRSFYLSVQQLISEKKVSHQGYDTVDLTQGNLVKGHEFLKLDYMNQIFQFSSQDNLLKFYEKPYQYYNAVLPIKLPLEKKPQMAKKSQDIEQYLEMNLGQTCMKVLAQLGKKKHKYLNLSIQETALKFLAIALKADNQYKDEVYRAKYQKKLDDFIKVCEMSEKLQSLYQKMNEPNWQQWDQKYLVGLATEFHSYQQKMQTTDKREHFMKYIR